MQVPQARMPWPSGSRTRVAGVSSFGLSGTNAYVVVAEAPRAGGSSAAPDRPVMVPLSARSPAALQSMARAWSERLLQDPPRLWDVAYTAGIRRGHHPYRLALVGDQLAMLSAALQAYAEGRSAPGVVSGAIGQAPPRVVFVFPGQGSQWNGMGRQLLAAEPVFRTVIESCDAAIRREAGWSLLEQLDAGIEGQPIDVIQPALFAMEIALAAQWRSWGVAPDAVVGHSMGEVAAAHVAGSLTLDDAVAVICRRSRLLRRVSGQGAMAVVELSAAEAQGRLSGYEDRLSVAVSNSPRSTVLSGAPEALEDVLARLEAEGIFCRRVKVDVASHSPQMDPLRDDLLAAVAAVHPRAGNVPIYSTVTAESSDGSAFTAPYWVRNLREPVQFFHAIQLALSEGNTVFIEISPHPILLPAIASMLPAEARALPTLRRDQGEQSAMLESLGALYTAGAPVGWQHLYPRGQVVSLPSYPWQRESYWVEAPAVAEAPAGPEWDVVLDWQTSPTPSGERSGSWSVVGSDSPELATLLSGDGERHGICYLAPPADDRPPAVRAAQYCQEVRALVDSVLQHPGRDVPRLWLVTRHGQRHGPVDPAQAALWGLRRSLAAEHPELRPTCVDLSFDSPWELLAQVLRADSPEEEIALSPAGRHVARLVRRPRARATPVPIRPDRSYALIGVSAGMVTAATQWLRERGATHLVVGSLSDVLAAEPPLAGLVMAGDNLAALWDVHEATLSRPLDFFVLCSSAASLLSMPDQETQAVAGAFMAGIAVRRQSEGLAGLSIDWAPFAHDGQPAQAERLALRGLGTLTSDQVQHALERLVGGTASQVGVWPLNVRQWLEFHAEAASSSLYAGLRPVSRATPVKAAAPPPTSFRSRLLAAGGDRGAVLEQFVRDQVAQVLRLEPAAVVRDVPFKSLGLESFMGLELRNRLEAGLGLTLAATLIWTYPQVATLSEQLGRMLDGAPALAAPDPVRGGVDPAESIAIIGVGCRFPGGAVGPDGFWDVLHRGVDAVREIPADRWSPDPRRDASTRWAALLEESDVTGFDAAFFGIAPREAESMDPQQRLLLEVAWEAFEQAGVPADQLSGSRTGVFLGMWSQDYEQQMYQRDELDPYSLTGVMPSIAAGRLSYSLGLQGPAFTVDTACSSSLLAVHLACQSLRQSECDMALAGGVNLVVSPKVMEGLAGIHALSVDGRCKTFDASANGYVRGEGCGFVVLKRLSAAQRAGDRIWAVVRGSAVNQDGRSTGLTAPNVLSQQALLRQALHNANVSPAAIGYIEAHGTGTPLGDPIEVDALKAVLGAPRPDESVCYLSSVKTNIGHMEGAAGVGGLIKTVLALQHEAIPRHLHFRALNPRIDLSGTPFVIPHEEQPWPRGDKPRLAGISSFGLSGTNVHVVVEEAPQEPAVPAAAPPAGLLVLSARDAAALDGQASRLAAHLKAHPDIALADLCLTASTGRSHFPHRLAVVAPSTERMQAALEAGSASRGVAPAAAPRVAFLFTGQGSQYAGMGRGLYDTHPIFRQTMDQCAAILDPLLPRPLLSVMFSDAEGLLDQTQFTQPALFALEYSLATLWRSWGVQPVAVLGHSIGELVAA
ncbi:MAG TPA: acyltransferase domain-containing protein, partial [Candidatus Xenobia bacterium]